MAQGGSNSEEEDDSQAAVEGPTCFESVHQDPWQESRSVIPSFDY